VLHDDVFLQDRAKAPERARGGGGVVQFSFGLKASLAEEDPADAVFFLQTGKVKITVV
jgi:hypothetical protein